jgi:predicted kinase
MPRGRAYNHHMLLRAEKDADILQGTFGLPPPPVESPFMVLISGLPGSGKSYLARRLSEPLGALVLQSDALRKTLFSKPDYTPGESGRLFRAMRLLAGRLLSQSIPVIIDATNIIESNRRPFYHEAESLGVRLFIIQATAPEEVVKERLESRKQECGQKSDADWEVYRKMAAQAEKIRRPHITIDTSKGMEPFIEKIVQEIRNTATITSSPKRRA